MCTVLLPRVTTQLQLTNISYHIKCQGITRQDGARPVPFQNFLCYFMYCLFLSFYVLFVFKCVLYYCHHVTTQLQLTNISYHIISLILTAVKILNFGKLVRNAIKSQNPSCYLVSGIDQYSNSLWAGRYRNGIRAGARFSMPSRGTPRPNRPPLK